MDKTQKWTPFLYFVSQIALLIRRRTLGRWTSKLARARAILIEHQRDGRDAGQMLDLPVEMPVEMPVAPARKWIARDGFHGRGRSWAWGGGRQARARARQSSAF